MQTISIKDAVDAAKKVIVELYHDDPPKNLALEEIELTSRDGKEVWEVTLGFFRPRSVNSNFNQLATIFERQREVENRVYKTVEIDAETGNFLRMVIRQV